MPFTAYQAATHAIGRSRRLLLVSAPQGSTAKLLNGNLRVDIRRMSVVMAVAALDTYMHRLILERAFKQSPVSKTLGNLTVRFEQLLNEADSSGAAARAAPHESRPRVAIKRQLRDRLLRETYQSSDGVSKALAMCGRSNIWESIRQNLDPSVTSEELKARLDDIVGRRNQIVHEGDYVRLERPRTARRNHLTYAQARDDIDFLVAFIDAIHSGA